MLNKPLTILGIAGSLRKASYNRAALRAAQQLAPERASIEIVDLAGIPPFNQDEERNPPHEVTQLKTRVRAADAILFVTPEYNYSIPGVLKNAIDWGSRPYGESCWDGKPVAVMGASMAVLGTSRAQYHLRQVFVYLNMHAMNLPEMMIGAAHDKFDAAGNLTDKATRQHIQKFLEALINWTERVHKGN